MINNEALKILQKNYGWIVALITGVGIITINVLKFIEYITSNIYFSYYGIDRNFYQYNNRGFIFDLCFSILFMFAFYSLCYCYKEIYLIFTNKLKKKKTLFLNLAIIIFSNIYVLLAFNDGFNLMESIICFFFLVVLEIISAIIISKTLDKSQDDSYAKNNINEIKSYLKLFPFLIIIMIFCMSLKSVIELRMQTEFRIINNNKVIVYSTEDYFLTLDCAILKDGELKIYKGTQEKIKNENIHSVITDFSKIDVDYKKTN